MNNRHIHNLTEYIERRSKVLMVLTLTGLALVGLFLFLWSTELHGIGIMSDSVGYIRAARTLVDGVGLGRLTPDGQFKPMNHFPPLYPSILALFEWVGIGAREGARLFGAAMYALNILLIGLSIYRLTRGFWFAALGSLVALIAPQVISVNLVAMTEAPFMTWALLSFLFLDIHLRQARPRWLVASAIFATLALLTRYVGTAVVASSLTAILILSGSPLVKRIQSSLVYLAISILPVSLWMGRNFLLTGSATNRNMIYHPVSSEKVLEMVKTVGRWGRPLLDTFAIGRRKIAAVILTLSVVSIHARYKAWRPKTPVIESSSSGSDLRWILLFFVFFYSLNLLSSLFFFDASTPLDNRILYPLLVTGLILFCNLLYWGWALLTRSGVKWWTLIPLTLFILILVSFLQSYGESAIQQFNQSRVGGLGLANVIHSQVTINHTLSDLPPEYVIFTDNPEKVYILTGRPSFRFPIKFDDVKSRPTGTYEDLISDVRRTTEQGNVIFLFYKSEPALKTDVSTFFPEMELVCECDNGLLYISQPKGE